MCRSAVCRLCFNSVWLYWMLCFQINRKPSGCLCQFTRGGTVCSPHYALGVKLSVKTCTGPRRAVTQPEPALPFLSLLPLCFTLSFLHLMRTSSSLLRSNKLCKPMSLSRPWPGRAKICQHSRSPGWPRLYFSPAALKGNKFLWGTNDRKQRPAGLIWRSRCEAALQSRLRSRHSDQLTSGTGWTLIVTGARISHLLISGWPVFDQEQSIVQV